MVAGRLRQTAGSPVPNGKGARGRNPGFPALLSRGGDRGQGGDPTERAALVRESERTHRIASSDRTATTSSRSIGRGRDVGIQGNATPRACKSRFFHSRKLNR